MRRLQLRHLLLCAALFAAACASSRTPAETAASRSWVQKRWLFVWRDMTDPKEVDRMIARFPKAHADGYNGVVFSYDVPAAKGAELRQAASAAGLDLVAIVMNGAHDRNNAEGLAVTDAPFIVKGRTAALAAEWPGLSNGDFEDAEGNHLSGWPRQLGEGVTTFVDRQVSHSGRASLRVESGRKSWFHPARVGQSLALQPHRQYRVSLWLKTLNLGAAGPEVTVSAADTGRPLNYQTFRVQPTQDWTHYDVTFNSMNASRADVSVGAASAAAGTLWWDDVRVEEIALVNVLRRPGCPVVVRGEDGREYEEGRDFERIVDPNLNPWIAYHPAPVITLTAGTRIHDGERLRVSYYHPIIVDDDRVTVCLSEPKVFEDWRAQVEQANARFHPAAFLMSHDELRVVNQCALCQGKDLTPGQLLAWNVRKAAQIIRDVRPDAGIWVWNDMFDPMHNAVDHYYAVNGSLRGSWEGLDADVGIVNWLGAVDGRNAEFFAERGLRQILAGYYDGDEDGRGIDRWLDRTSQISGVEGAMYTTWQDRYDAMDAWAARAWGGALVRRE